MTRIIKAGAALFVAVGLSGCAAEVGTAIGMQIQKSMARGEPIGKYRGALSAGNEVATTLDGQPAFTWDMSYYEDVTIQKDGYAYKNTDRPGYTTGLIYENRTVHRQCLLTMAYDPQTLLVTDLELTNAVTCRRVRSLLREL